MREIEEDFLTINPKIVKKLNSIWIAFLDESKNIKDDTIIQKLIDFLRHTITIEKNLGKITLINNYCKY